MISTLSETCKSLNPQPVIHKLGDFCLDITAAGGNKVPYLGYSLLEISFPYSNFTPFPVPILNVPDTDYSCSVPLIVGTNILHFLKSSDVKGLSLPISNALASLASGHSYHTSHMFSSETCYCKCI